MEASESFFEDFPLWTSEALEGYVSELEQLPIEELEEHASELEQLPHELILMILNHLDDLSLRRLCLVNQFFRNFCLDAALQERLEWNPILLSTGDKFTGTVDSWGNLFLWGLNVSGQLGLPENIYSIPYPSQVEALAGKKVLSLSCGFDFTGCVTKKEGELYTWGENHDGQLGLGHKKDMFFPQRVDALFGQKILSISCGFSHTAAITVSGALYAWGNNYSGQLGLGHTLNFFSDTPQLVKSLMDQHILMVSCGRYHTACITETGFLYTWGDNIFGNLGLGHTIAFNTPQLVESLIDHPILMVSCGWSHMGCITETGELYMWGGNNRGQVGVESISDRFLPEPIPFRLPVTDLSCGHDFTGCVLENGELYLWGNNREGQLGLGHTMSKSVPTQVTLLGAHKIVEISCGYDHAGAMTSEGKVYLWGNNTQENYLGLESSPTLVPDLTL